MKILITTDTYTSMVNGVVRSIVNLKNILTDMGNEVRVMTLSERNYSYKNEEVYYIKSIRVNPIYPNARFSFNKKDELVREIIDWNPDIIHFQSEFSSFYIANKIKKECNCPIVHTYHTIYEDYTHYFSPSKIWGAKIIRKFTRLIANYSDYIIAPTQKTKDILKKYDIEDRKILISPTGIEISNTKPVRDEKYILYLGRIAKEKNIKELIDYYKKLDTKYKFVIAGDGPYRKELMEYANDENIEFVGMVSPDKVDSYYKNAIVFISASTSETQGLTYIEALSNGAVCILRKDRCIENVIIDGFNGYKYENFNQFKNFVEYVIQNDSLRENMSNNAYDYAKDNFSIESFGKRTFEIYNKAIDKISYKISA